MKDGEFTLDITIPANTTATVYVPAANAAAVQESGKPAAEAEGAFTLDITIPANTSATVYVPAANAAAVQESGKPAAEAEGVKLLRAEKGEAVFEVQSGVYRFTVR